MGGAADAAGLQNGDVVLAAGGRVAYSWGDFVEAIRSSPGEPLEIIYLRDGEELTAVATPAVVNDGDGPYGRLGVVPRFDEKKHAELLVTQREGPIEAAVGSLRRVWVAIATTVRFIGHMVAREVSTDNLSGPVGIAQSASLAVSLGLVVFLKFVAQISISLGVINLVPIPVLDGGHLLRYAIEGVTRRPLPDRIIRAASVFGVFCILALMVFAIYNDLT